MSLLPQNHLAPYEIRSELDDKFRGRRLLKDGEHYFPLFFDDGTPRMSVAVFTYDPVGVGQQLREKGYKIGQPLRARRS